MSSQISDLTVNDPLTGEEVTVVVRVLPDNAHRPARTALVSVGTAGQPPTFATGMLEEVNDLIRQAWLAYGVLADVRSTAMESAAAEGETVAENADESGDDRAPSVQPQPPVTIAQPSLRLQNLSLF